jgi:hypothetical protein
LIVRYPAVAAAPTAIAATCEAIDKQNFNGMIYTYLGAERSLPTRQIWWFCIEERFKPVFRSTERKA